MRTSVTILAILLSVSINSLADAPDTLWTRVHSISPEGDIDDGKCVRQTSDGGYVITGATVPDGLVSHIDLLLLRTDAQGHTVWTKTYGKEFIEEGLSVAETPDGGFVIAGRTLWITGPNPPSDNQSDVWLLRANANGDTLWTKTFGGEGHDFATSVLQTPDLGYLVAGTTNSGRSYPPNCITEFGASADARAWLIRTDSDGDTLWTRTFAEGSYGNCVEMTSDGGFLLLGSLMSADQIDILLVKVDTAGDPLWSRVIGRSDSLEFGRCVREVADGYVIAGHAAPVTIGPADALLMKTDSDGFVVWQKTYGGRISDCANSVDVAPDGRLFVAGNANTLYYIHIGDMWAFETDSSGELLWQRQYDISRSDYSWSGIVTADGGYVVAGLLGYSFGGDLWLAKLGEANSTVPVERQGTTALALGQNRPNPFHSSTMISYRLPASGRVSLTVYDVQGREIQSLVRGFQAGEHYSVEFAGHGLASGIYYYRLTWNGRSETRRMVLLR